MPAGTNYPVSPDQANRLNALWNRTGRDWSNDESVARLWAYSKTAGEAISRLAGTPVASVALLIRRPVSSVYNEIMNFRSLDPRDPRDGLSGSSATDRRVWDKFFRTASSDLDQSVLDAEFNRLWPVVERAQIFAPDLTTLSASMEIAVRRLDSESLARLITKYLLNKATKAFSPKTTVSSTRIFERDPLVVAIARKRANYLCEVPHCGHPRFQSDDGVYYCEVHHIEPLAEGGDDIIENAACVCPSHHRELHFGRDRAAVSDMLRELRSREAP